MPISGCRVDFDETGWSLDALKVPKACCHAPDVGRRFSSGVPPDLKRSGSHRDQDRTKALLRVSGNPKKATVSIGGIRNIPTSARRTRQVPFDHPAFPAGEAGRSNSWSIGPWRGQPWRSRELFEVFLRGVVSKPRPGVGQPDVGHRNRTRIGVKSACPQHLHLRVGRPFGINVRTTP